LNVKDKQVEIIHLLTYNKNWNFILCFLGG